jgi:hypothetical protein
MMAMMGERSAVVSATATRTMGANCRNTESSKEAIRVERIGRKFKVDERKQQSREPVGERTHRPVRPAPGREARDMPGDRRG